MKNEIFQGKATSITADGLGVVIHQGHPCLVKGLLPMEEAKVRVISEKKDVSYGKIETLLESSPHRMAPACASYGPCGGCQLMHMDYPSQLELKVKQVRDSFHKFAHQDPILEPILGAPQIDRYRNKVQVPFQVVEGKVIAGFYASHSNRIVPFEDCICQSKESNTLVHWIQSKAQGNAWANSLRHVLIKHAFSTHQMMVVFVMKQEEELDSFVEELVQAFPEVKSVILNLHPQDNNVILGEKEILLYGQATIEEHLGDYHFEISSKSFFQVYSAQALRLYQKALEYARIQKDDTVLDLYCGTGTIGLFAASYAKEVLGIEIVQEAVENAKINAQNNGITNASFWCMDAGEGATKILEEKRKIQTVFVDPPRKGLDQKTKEALQRIAPNKIVYVSCNPTTLARDVKDLEEQYVVQRVGPVDLFPMTSHVETVVLLTEK